MYTIYDANYPLYIVTNMVDMIPGNECRHTNSTPLWYMLSTPPIILEISPLDVMLIVTIKQILKLLHTCSANVLMIWVA